MYEVGAEKGKYYSVNVPLKDGIDDNSEYIHVLLVDYPHSQAAPLGTRLVVGVNLCLFLIHRLHDPV